MSEKLRDLIEENGYCVIPSPLGADVAAWAPLHFAESVLGEPVEMAEHQPIKPVPQGRSFASTTVETPLHTDSQFFRGAPPDVQLLVCLRQAKEGGEPTLFDGFALLDRIAAADPDFYRALFFVQRTIPFVFGDVHGPTIALRRGRLSFAHSPVSREVDAIHARLSSLLAASPWLEISLRPGDLLVVDNRRMLHGRRAFSDLSRELCRVLCWLRSPLPEPDKHRKTAEEAARTLGLALEPKAETNGQARLRVVMAMLRGVPPGVLAAREGIPEPELYRMRDVAMLGAERALEEGTQAPAGPSFWQKLFRRRS